MTRREGGRNRPSRSMAKADTTWREAPPESPTITEYDRTHMVLYMRIFDAADDGADWREVVEVLFNLDPQKDPERCKRIHDSHLARARWMTTHGYRELLRQGQNEQKP